MSLLTPEMMIGTPKGIAAQNHLQLCLNDIARPEEGLKEPESRHVQKLIGFLQDWPQDAPLLIHCWAGISRSTAAAFIAMCLFNPDEMEVALAKILRFHAPEASPNPLLVAHADAILGRKGRMRKAIMNIGRGQTAFEGTHFTLPVYL
jgi:predicted protein tyrosine phosphatase